MIGAWVLSLMECSCTCSACRVSRCGEKVSALARRRGGGGSGGRKKECPSSLWMDGWIGGLVDGLVDGWVCVVVVVVKCDMTGVCLGCLVSLLHIVLLHTCDSDYNAYPSATVCTGLQNGGAESVAK